jgi:histidyl-tRNA synthetase
MRVQSIRGFNDVLPADSALWQRVHDTARQVFEAYGYGEIRLPMLERIELFKRAVGEVTDVVEKEMYAFEDRGGEWLALRPEGTAGCVRAGVEHGLLHNQQQRLWYAGPMFRYERPQAGRYRQFHQIGVEAYGMPGADADLEVVAMSARLWKRLGFSGLRLEINSLGGGDTRARYRAALVEYLSAHEAQLDEDSRRRMGSNPLRVLDSKVPQTQAIVHDAPSILDHLDAESAAHFERLQQGLVDLDIGAQVNPRLVRGLDYYTGPVFEWITNELGAQGTVCAGGRYDRLVEQLGGSPTPAVGWASGVERLILLLQAQNPPASPSVADLYVCAFGEQGERAGRRLAEQLRDVLPELRLMLNAGGGKPAAQLKRADRSGAAVALVLGDSEAAEGTAQVKSLRKDLPQQSCAWAELPGLLRSLLA